MGWIMSVRKMDTVQYKTEMSCKTQVALRLILNKQKWK